MARANVVHLLHQCRGGVLWFLNVQGRKLLRPHAAGTRVSDVQRDQLSPESGDSLIAFGQSVFRTSKKIFVIINPEGNDDDELFFIFFFSVIELQVVIYNQLYCTLLFDIMLKKTHRLTSVKLLLPNGSAHVKLLSICCNLYVTNCMSREQISNSS